MCTGACYLEGYIGDDEPKSNWLIERILTWEKNINTISKPRGNIPRRVTPQWYVKSNNNGYLFNASPGKQETCFAGVKKTIRKTFLPCLFFGRKKTLSPAVGDLIKIPVKKAGMRLMNPVT